MNYKYKVSIIIVNFNGKRYIDNLFNSLEKVDTFSISTEIIFVDNNSSDDSIAYLKTKYMAPNLRIIESKENLGFAGGNNLGVKYAQGEYIVFLNNDTKVEVSWLKELLNTIEKEPTIGIVNSKLLFFYDFLRVDIKTNDKFLVNKHIEIDNEVYIIDNKFSHNLLYGDEMTCMGNSYFYIPLLKGVKAYEFKLAVNSFNKDTDYIFIGENKYEINGRNFVNIPINIEQVEKNKVTLIQNAGSGVNENYDGFDIGFGEEDGPKYNKEYEINNACGASFIIRKEDFDKIGGFDESFFMYYEDVDLSYRVKKLGKRIMYAPTSIVRHVHTGSSKEWSDFFVYHVVKNKILFMYKNIDKKKSLLDSIKHFLKGGINRKAAIKALKIIMSSKKMGGR